MIWGVGTGRCGTTSYAEEIGGLHEPGHSTHLKHLAKGYYPRGFYANEIKGHLREIMAMGRPAVDNGYSFIIPLIMEVDPVAEIHWLIREPRICIESMWNYGFYGLRDGKEEVMRVSPLSWPDHFTRLMKLTWYWISTNRKIAHDAPGARIVRTDELSLRLASKGDYIKPDWSPFELDYPPWKGSGAIRARTTAATWRPSRCARTVNSSPA